MSSPVNAKGLFHAKSTTTSPLQTAEMAPDPTTRYVEDANRLVDVAVNEVIVRLINRRRITIAPVIDTLRVNPITPADIMREVVTESDNPSFGSAGPTEAA